MLKFKSRLLLAFQVMFCVVTCGGAYLANAAGEIRIEIPVVPSLDRYADLLAYPGYFSVALENNGLSPSLSSKLKVKERGRVLEIRNATLKYVSVKGAIYSYEAAVTLDLGVADSRLAFPVTIDLSNVSSGKVVATATPPLANLFPSELTDRIRIKAGLIANINSQQKMIDYLDGLAGSVPDGSKGAAALIEPILVDAYNKGGGPVMTRGHDVGEAVPLSDQWMLLLTLVIWLLIVPAALLYQRLRARRNETRRA